MSLISSLLAMLGNNPLFTLKTPAGDELRVVRFFGREGLSSLFEFHLELAGGEVDLAAMVDTPAVLKIDGIEAPRHVSGIFAAFEYVGHSRHLQLYEAQLVPWVWRLQHRHDCRIFQDKSTPDILKEVLTGAGLSSEGFRFDLLGTYGLRNYCVQYRESDLSFISRLMEESGIYYYFEHSADKHVLVMADHPGAHRPIPGTPVLWFNPPGGMVAEREHVQQFRFGERVRPGKVSMRDFNMHKPGLPMEAADAAKVRAELEVYSYPGRYQDPGQGAPHHGQSLAKLRLEALQAHRRTGAGSSDCPRITAGHTMSLLGHPRPELDTEYRILHVSHAGNQPQVLDQDASGEFSYSNEFGVSERSQPFRAEQTTPKPHMQGLQTATVVGPESEEIYPDEHGRVKVKFHWDRAESFDETSSCWVRVSQMWAGNSWGTMVIPRIGHEVLIDFIEGDPDRPVIVGRIHTGDNMPRYELPAGKTKTTIRSESSPGGGGFNELSFEDDKGKEEVFLHAQKDLNTFAHNFMNETVGNSRTSSIGSNESINVGANRTVNVATNDSTTVGNEHKVTIATPPPVVIKFPEIPFIPLPPSNSLLVPPTTLIMRSQFIELSDGPKIATITINGPDVSIKASGKITIDAGGAMDLIAGGALSLTGASVDITARKGGDVKIQGGPMVKINC
jgi:type VI secretion system secreted protein VgrG